MEEIDGKLEKIEANTRPVQSFLLTLSGRGSKIEKTFQPEIIGGTSYKMAFTSLDTYFAIPNIITSNNSLEISKGGGAFVSIALAKGCYGMEDLNREVNRLLKCCGMVNGVQFNADYSTFRCIMTIKEGFIVRFKDSSLRTVLGFEVKEYAAGRFISEHTVQIMYVNSILVHCDLVSGSYLNGVPSPIIHSFFPTVNPGEKIIERPVEFIYLPVNLDAIRHMTVWLTDQNLNLLDLGEEEVTVKFHLTSI